MEEYNLIYILIFLIFSILIYFTYFNNRKVKKPSAIKKEELIKNYENEMLELIKKYGNDKIKLQEKKIEFLKVSSKDLHKNIFFDEYEVKEIIKKLATL